APHALPHPPRATRPHLLAAALHRLLPLLGKRGGAPAGRFGYRLNRSSLREQSVIADRSGGVDCTAWLPSPSPRSGPPPATCAPAAAASACTCATARCATSTAIPRTR